MADYEKDKSETRREMNSLERLRETFRDEVDDLVRLELDVEELAERKAGLIRQYLRDDVHGIREFWEDLKAETRSLEGFVSQWLLQAANPTPLDWIKLDHYIDRNADLLIAGEHATNAELSCIGCGKLRVIDGQAVIKPCSRCGCELYRIR